VAANRKPDEQREDGNERGGKGKAKPTDLVGKKCRSDATQESHQASKERRG
jgi:hypothetical protein